MTLSIALCILVLSAPFSRVFAEERYAPASYPPTAPTAWRVIPPRAGVARPKSGGQGPSYRFLLQLKSALGTEEDGKAKRVIADALEAFIANADSLGTDRRQDWIDGHLGELNVVVRAASTLAPKSLLLKAATGLARLNNRAERWDESRELAELAVRADPQNMDALIERSRAAAGLGDFARAYADGDAVVRAFPDAPEGWAARSAASYGLGNHIQALSDARRATTLDPTGTAASALMPPPKGRGRSSPHVENGDLGSTIEREYHAIVQQLNQVKSVRLTPPEQPLHEELSLLLDNAGRKLSLKDYLGAMKDADSVLAAAPDNTRALYFRAAAENLLGRYTDAARDASRALILAPAIAPLRDVRSWAFLRMGRFDDALDDAKLSLEINPHNPYAFANRAHAHEGLGQYEAMASDLRTAAGLDAQFKSDYHDSVRRHTLPVESVTSGSTTASLAKFFARNARSLAVVLAFSLSGGLLISLGLMRIGTGFLGSRSKEPSTPPILAPRYEIGKAIGQGGMGVVYEAHDKCLNRPVAVKMLRDEFLLDEIAKRDFFREARTVSELRHPSIVEIYAVEQDERGLYMVFERLRGRTLDESIAEHKKLPLTEAKRVLGQVCAALDYAHARDVVHMDLKPANIMLTLGGGVKVLDFGIARHAARVGKAAATTQSLIGTPHYMAPEQEYGFVRKENDVFSLGTVLYEMVTGMRPYEGPTAAKLAKRYLPPSQRVADLSPGLDELIDHALEPDPAKRIDSPAEFWARLNALAEVPPAAG